VEVTRLRSDGERGMPAGGEGWGSECGGAEEGEVSRVGGEGGGQGRGREGGGREGVRGGRGEYV